MTCISVSMLALFYDLVGLSWYNLKLQFVSMVAFFEHTFIYELLGLHALLLKTLIVPDRYD